MKNELFDKAEFRALTRDYAIQISQWEYEKPYDIYSFKPHKNNYLFDEKTWGTEQFCLVEGDCVIGQVACQLCDEDIWVGWALDPRLCGNGNSAEFVIKCVSEIRKIKNINGDILLRVAFSNKRAIKAYQKAGFEYKDTIQDEVAYTGNVEDFWVMRFQN